jgi:acetyl-CoA carboxylase biotin carboxylase subunit
LEPQLASPRISEVARLLKLLIANRGEIALRIIRTCRKLGVRTVQTYSDPDRDSLPLRYADERYALGGATPTESYLNIEKLVHAALKTGCDAVHPGYGFLSEESSFVKACEENGLTFIGPSSKALEKLGNKLSARETMRQAGVPVIPGSDGTVNDGDEAVRVAEDIGYPVILKAVYGGGGRGMRIAKNSDETRRFFRVTKLESLSAFGRGDIYIEKRLASPRHVEIQALCDKHGKVVSLGERECSIQRRHQKLLEEAPSVAVSEGLRQRLNEAAKKGLSAAGYTNAGTVEFLLAKSGEFYFLEVNKRLQVEHLVTEMTTNIDLVEEQLKIATTSSLELSQNEIHINGWAINCRINAEDPRNFAPSPGTVIHYHPPTGPGVRVDSALFSGYTIPEYYDSMVAKLATRGRDREEAIQRMRVALDEIEIAGVPTTIPLHKLLMHDEGFIQGNFDTTYLNSKLPQLNSNLLRLEKFAAVAAATCRLGNPARPPAHETDGASKWRTWARAHHMLGHGG